MSSPASRIFPTISCACAVCTQQRSAGPHTLKACSREASRRSWRQMITCLGWLATGKAFIHKNSRAFCNCRISKRRNICFMLGPWDKISRCSPNILWSRSWLKLCGQSRSWEYLQRSQSQLLRRIAGIVLQRYNREMAHTQVSIPLRTIKISSSVFPTLNHPLAIFASGILNRWETSRGRAFAQPVNTLRLVLATVPRNGVTMSQKTACTLM